MLVCGRRKYTPIKIEVEGSIVSLTKAVRILEIQVDRSINFRELIRNVVDRALKAVTAISRLFLNVGGPSEPKRRFPASVAEFIMLYGAPIWVDNL